MGNCQAIDAATLVIQHPNGKTERFYSPVSAAHLMKTNPGHYVALIISTTTLCTSTSKANNTTNTNDNNNVANFPKKIENNNKDNTINNPVRITRIKLLKPTDTLQLGQVYRLITAQEVMKGLKERKKSKMKQQSMSSESSHKEDCVKEKLGLEMENAAKSSDSEDKQVTKHERHRTRTTTASSNNHNNNNGGSVITAKTRFWQPSLQSISESAS